MADGGNQRDAARGGGAGQGLVIEGPEVLHRSPAPRHDQHVGARHRSIGRQRVETPNGGGHLSGGLVPLHHHRPDYDSNGPAIGDAVKDVADHRAGRAGDHADDGGRLRQGGLAGRVEEPLPRQFRLEAFQLGEECADSGRLEALDDDLIAGPRGIGRDPPGDDDLKPLLRLGFQPPHLPLPDDPVDGGLVVLEGEVDVTGSVSRDLGDLAPQAHMAEGVLQRPLQREGELGDGKGRRVAGGRLGGVAHLGL